MAEPTEGKVAARVAALERAHGIEVVTASIAKADVYPELPWRAGALAASLTALCVAIGDVLRPDWATSTTLLVSLATVMIVGAGVSLLTIFSPALARLFLSRTRAEVEVRQFAHAFFLERQLFRTRRRLGVLLLIARFEHRVEVVADVGYEGRSPRRVGQHHPADAAAAARGPGRRRAGRGARRARRAALVARLRRRRTRAQRASRRDDARGRGRPMIAIVRPFRVVALAALLLAPLAALAADVPYLTGRVVDNANILSAGAKQKIAQIAEAREKASGDQVVVLTMPSLEGESIEGYATRVFDAWKLGQKGKDNGVLVIVAPSDRKMRIEVGYGLEGTLTDAAASRIVREAMTPRFKQNDFDGGVTAACRRSSTRSRARATGRRPGRRRPRRRRRQPSPASRRSTRSCRRGRCASCSARSSSGSSGSSPSSA
jgi:uncharacterized membrane protein YgcG